MYHFVHVMQIILDQNLSYSKHIKIQTLMNSSSVKDSLQLLSIMLSRFNNHRSLRHMPSRNAVESLHT